MKRFFLMLTFAAGSAVCMYGDAVTSADPVARAYALQRMGRQGAADDVSVLAKALDDSEPNVAYAAAQSLAQIASAEAAQALLSAVKAGRTAVAGDAVLMCAAARCAVGDDPNGRALYEACYAADKPELKWAAFAWLAARDPEHYAAAVKAQLVSADRLSSAAAVRAVEANPALMPAALAAAKDVEGAFKARIIAALARFSAQPDVKSVMMAALRDADELVRVAALRAVVASADNDYIEDIFRACSSDSREEREAALILAASFSAPGMDDFLYGQMKNPASRVLAIELLAERHEKRLIGRLCDAALYDDANTVKAAAKAFRTALQSREFADALGFVCTKLSVAERADFVAALSAVAQQLPDQRAVEKAVAVQFNKLDTDGRKSLLPLYAAMQSAEVCKKLADDLDNSDVEYRKEIVRSLAKWSNAEALDALVKCAEENSDGAVQILALRSALTLLSRKGVSDNNRKVAVLKTLAGKAVREAEKRLIFQEVKRVPTQEAQALRKELAEKFGIEIVAEGATAKKELKITGFQPAVVVKPFPKPVDGRINVMLLTGANNHNWQETTAALREVFAQDARFAVAAVENPWEMKPADIEGFDLLLSNWNTFGKDKREWNAEMKAGFIEWVKKGGGFFVLHAGGSIFYDWDEFQSLTGGSWEKGTFHPHMQSFTVKIADREHPVTRGLVDFDIFDEPWQRVANRNSDRHVLLTSVISKENRGSGAVEPFAWTTQLGKGRCFTLMLGHDGRAIRTAGCRALILRGSEWAATGQVK